MLDTGVCDEKGGRWIADFVTFRHVPFVVQLYWNAV
jgi:hypothetical protein